MIDIGRSTADMKKLAALMVSPHNIRITVRLLDLDHRYLGDLSRYFVSGQVSVDAESDVTRALDLTLLDPHGSVNIDPDSPGRASVYIADMISIIYTVQSPDRSLTFNIPVFCGPVDSVVRNDVFLDIKCVGKESLSLNNVWIGRNFKKGQRKVEVMRRILRDLCGETKIRIEGSKGKMPNPLKLNRDDSPWIVARRLGSTINRHLFYNGRGIAVARPRGKGRPVLHLDARWRTTDPQMSYDFSATINAVDVIGAKTKKSKKAIRYRSVAKRNHPLSPWRLGRGGRPRYLWVEISDDSIRSKKEAKKVADRTLRQGLLAGITVECDGIPHPCLEENDIVRVSAPGINVIAPMKKFTIPLVAGDDASYGYLKKMKPKGGPRGVKKKKRRKKNNRNTHRNRITWEGDI